MRRCALRRHPKKSGWLKKYSKRRKLCPDVETWEERVLPRINKEDIKSFEVVKGRVALNFTHNKILGGNEGDAKEIVRKYGHLYPKTRLSRLIIMGYKHGYSTWRLITKLIKLRERLNDL